MLPPPLLHQAVTPIYELHIWYICCFVVLGLRSLPPEDATEEWDQLHIDLETLYELKTTRYLRLRPPVPKSSQLGLLWAYYEDPAYPVLMLDMAPVSPRVFDFILEMIQDHPVFTNESTSSQAPIDEQLAITLFRLGHYGNAASVKVIARQFGCSEGEKEVEKCWIAKELGMEDGLWKEGWLMYDGTIVVLYRHPGYQGDGYYTRKANYGLNVQACSNLLADFDTSAKFHILDRKHTFESSRR
ncbi:hypothetical protein BDZ89DRAFT_969538 [Hymenopellis radicata]|nr:hypothetical protein BDZ89DRAFT_969538 [Hymenopellis radicata]